MKHTFILMKIVIDQAIPDLEHRLRQVADVRALPAGEISRNAVADADALVVRTRTRCDAGLLDGSSVKMVVTATAGTDHIDIDWCESHGIHVASAAGSNAPGVAQYVMAALDAAGYRPGLHLLGVVGKGHVGSIVTSWARLMGGQVYVCDPFRQDAGMEDDEYRSLEMMLRRCDAITFHVPLTCDGPYPTFHMLNENNIPRINPRAIIVNAARGGVIDEAALLKKMRRRDTSITCITDTWEGEPDISRELLDASLIATPHIAGYSLEGKQRATRMVIEALEEFFALNIDKSGLAESYRRPHNVARERICASYDPLAETAVLRRNPADFERLRNTYHFRNEPVF